MNVNDVLFGFRVDNCRESAELNGKLWEMTHEKTGAKLAWLDNGEDNKVFSIAFKTIPWDDTGVFHILEHSVLCGSDNFPVKEPFLDLLKSSMNTFLNAMTFADKTVYPVSSRNEQDYLNLARVYLDAVLYPAIYTNPSIFYQEGWHYEISEENDEPIYKGVVFNEMKGSMSSVDRQVESGICRMLFPDNCYGYNSGGDPRHIPELTYEAFKNAHKTFYHPTNSKIYLDGNVPLERILKLISEDYLDNFDFSDAKHEIPRQDPVPAVSIVDYYSIGKEEDTKGKAQLALGKIIANWNERKKITAASVLGSYLTATNESPLKRAVLESGLAQDMYIFVDDSVYQPYVVTHIRNTDGENKAALRDIIRKCINRIADEGLDKEELAAIISQLEFAAKEAHEPKGIIRNISALNSWLHDGDPMDYLESDDLIADLREEIAGDYYENLLKEIFLDEEYTAELCLLPSCSKGEEIIEEEKAKLSAAKLSWSEDDKSAILALNKELERWQTSVDTPEAIATLPKLSLCDVSEKPEWIPTDLEDKSGVKILHHPLPTSGIVTCNMYFSLYGCTMSQLQDLAIVAQLLDELPTEKYTAVQLQRNIKRYIGRISYAINTYNIRGDRYKVKPYFTVSFSALECYLKEACELVVEILKNTDYSSFGQIKEILLQNIEAMNQGFITNGRRYAMTRAQANFSAAGMIEEEIAGYNFYRRLADFGEKFDESIDAFRSAAESFKSTVFNSGRLTISETSLSRHSEIGDMIAAIGEGNAPESEIIQLDVSSATANEAIVIPSGVSYAAMCSHLGFCEKEYTPALPVLSTILSFGYLWNEIRVRGGAYGCGFRSTESGDLAFHSYRDPSPIRSLGIYRDTAKFIRDFVSSDEEIEKYIISTISSGEPLMTPSRKGSLADARYFTSATYEDKLKLRAGMLKLTKSDLLDVCDLFEDMTVKSAVCVVGGEANLAGDETLKIYKL